MHHDRIDRGLLQQHDVTRKGLRGFLVAHGMAAIFDDDGFLVVFLHMRQRLGQDAGLVERADMGGGHERVSHGGRWRDVGPVSIRLPGRAQSGPVAVLSRAFLPSPTREEGKSHPRLGHAAAIASASQLAINSVPPVGAAIGKRPWPAYCRSARSPANSTEAMTKPIAAANPMRA